MAGHLLPLCLLRLPLPLLLLHLLPLLLASGQPETGCTGLQPPLAFQ